MIPTLESKITFSELSLILLVGPPNSEKTAFAQKNFLESEILTAPEGKNCFEFLSSKAIERLSAGKLTVIDAPLLDTKSRRPWIELARSHHFPPVAIVFNLPNLSCSMISVAREGFKQTFVLSSAEQMGSIVLEREAIKSNRLSEKGPFDLIGDIHGCYDELKNLLEILGYVFHSEFKISHPDGRKVIFLGDLVDRGPKTPEVLKLVMNTVEAQAGFCVPGNHDLKLMRKLRGDKVSIRHGLAESLEQLEKETPEFVAQVVQFIQGMTSHYVLDDGNLVVAHAGLKESMQGRSSGTVLSFALFGETTGEIDEYGLPIRYDWASEYRGKATVVYGHTPILEAQWVNNTIDIDTGCVFGGKLTALRYPEKTLVSVQAAKVYFLPTKPLASRPNRPR